MIQCIMQMSKWDEFACFRAFYDVRCGIPRGERRGKSRTDWIGGRTEPRRIWDRHATSAEPCRRSRRRSYV